MFALLKRENLDNIVVYTPVAMQRHGKRASTTVELLLETVFSMWSVTRSYLEDHWATQLVESSVLYGGL
jgi:hypothetical protein